MQKQPFAGIISAQYFLSWYSCPAHAALKPARNGFPLAIAELACNSRDPFPGQVTSRSYIILRLGSDALISLLRPLAKPLLNPIPTQTLAHY